MGVGRIFWLGGKFLQNYIKKFLDAFKNLFSTNIEMSVPFQFPKVDVKKDISKLELDKMAKLDGQKNPLDKVIDELKDQKKLIFIDEFQIEDVADAMIIAEIMPKLSLKEIPLFISSNSSVDELYENGLQREKLIKSLQFIKNDWRINQINIKDRF